MSDDRHDRRDGEAQGTEDVLAKMRLSSEQPGSHGGRQLTPAAQRALAEAEERRRMRAAETVHPEDLPKELNGRDGPEPVRYGDWEKNGIISDF